MKREQKIISVLAACVIVGGMMSGCGISGKNRLVGRWDLKEDSVKHLSEDYPEENFIIYEDGTFACDDVSGEYSCDKNYLTISCGQWATYTYRYQISSGKLTLRHVDEEEDGCAIYKRAK